MVMFQEQAMLVVLPVWLKAIAMEQPFQILLQWAMLQQQEKTLADL